MARRMTRVVRMAGLVAMIGGLSLLSGCNKGGKADQDLLMQENGELRQRIAQLEANLAANDEQLAQLSEENQHLRSAAEARPEPSAADPDPYAAGTPGTRELSPGLTVSTNPRGEVVLAIAGDVLFDSGSAELKKSSRATLERVAELLNGQYRNNGIRVEGYTDSDPIRKSDWGTNERLSAERALAVETYLVQHGVRNERIYSAAFGPAKPKSSKSASRRVEVVVLANDS